jgi:hypothetical protein
VAAPVEVLLPVAQGGNVVARAIFGSVERVEASLPAQGAAAMAIFGSVELDLRHVRLPPGVTELRVQAILGSVEITVPPDLAVDMRGLPIFGSFEGLDRVPVDRTGEPILRIVGAAVLGSVEIHTLPRESERLPLRRR